MSTGAVYRLWYQAWCCGGWFVDMVIVLCRLTVLLAVFVGVRIVDALTVMMLPFLVSDQASVHIITYLLLPLLWLITLITAGKAMGLGTVFARMRGR